MIYFDLDGVIRDMGYGLFGEKGPGACWRQKIYGQTISNYIDRNLNILIDSPPTKYYPLIKENVKCPTILTHQHKSWVPNTKKWLDKYIGEYEIIVVDSPHEKESFLKDGDFLLDDYPSFSPEIVDKLLLISYNYNMHSPCKVRITEPEDLLPYLVK